MTLLANRRSAILLFSLPNCLESHRTRIVIKEKEISAEIHEVDLNNIPEEIKILSPYDEYPSLVDRELVLQNSRVIIEYLDERFPHMSDDFGLVDCSIAPLLWRLKSLDFDLAENNKVIGDYSERIFEREAFQDSLTETEKELF